MRGRAKVPRKNICISSSNDAYHQERSELYVTSLSDHDIIFGTDWLQAHNPEVNWSGPQLAFTRCPSSCSLSRKPLVITPKYRVPCAPVINSIAPVLDEATQDEDPDFASEANDVFLQFHVAEKDDFLPIRSKSTTSTQLAARSAPETSTTHVPTPYLEDFARVFSKEASHRLPAHQPWDHKIDLVPNVQMKNCGVYRLTPKEDQAMKTYIAEQLAKGYIRKSESPFASPFFFVDKKDSKLRPVQDYHRLNDITVKNAASLPLIADLIDSLRGARYFTKFDIRWGYNNIRITKGDEWKAAFRTNLGLFEPLVMTFGLCNAPATFQTFMNSIFQTLIAGGHVVVYLDDILIFHNDAAELDKLTRVVLEILAEHDLFLKPEKCSFNKTSIEYLGVYVSEGSVTMDPAKVAGILNWPVPTCLKHVQAFLGFCNFYRRFIKDYAAIARPLFDLSRKEELSPELQPLGKLVKLPVPFVWGDAQNNAFRTLINAFTSAPVLALPDHDKPFRLITDASDFATGAILEQPDALNRWHPVAYFSKSLQPAERNYEIHDKELLAIIRALETFRHYLEGRLDVLDIWSDHGNLVYFNTKQKLTRRQARWALFLSRFHFCILHKPGVYNKSDTLSQRPDHREGMEHDNEERVLLKTKYFTIRAARPATITVQGDTSLRDKIRAAQDYDTEVSKALESIIKNGPRSVTKGLEDWNLEDGIILFKGHVYVPKNPDLRKEIVKRYHDHIAAGHPGRWKTYELVSREFWWPGMSVFVKDYVDGCATCQSTKVRPRTQVPLKPNQVPTDVWGVITMDFITDLPLSQGFDSLFVVVDRFSKAAIFLPCHKTITADGTAKLYLDGVW